MKVRELKEILNKCSEDMEVIIPVSNEEQVDNINHVYSVTTAAIIQQFNDKAILLNTSSNKRNISDQLNIANPLNLHCEELLFPHIKNKSIPTDVNNITEMYRDKINNLSDTEINLALTAIFGVMKAVMDKKVYNISKKYSSHKPNELQFSINKKI